MTESDATTHQKAVHYFEVCDNGDTVTKISKEDLSAFRFDTNLPEEKSVIEKRMKVQVSKPDLEGNKWLLKTPDGKFWAAIIDPDFSKKVHMGEVAFAAGGTLDVDLVVYRTMTSEKTTDKHEILKVHSYTPGPRQLSLGT